MLIVSILERFKTFSTRELLLAAFLLSAITGVAAAETGTQLGKARFQWAGVDHPSVVGYTIHWGTQSGVYTESADLGLVTDVVLQKFQPGVEYFAAISDHFTESKILSSAAVIRLGNIVLTHNKLCTLRIPETAMLGLTAQQLEAMVEAETAQPSAEAAVEGENGGTK